MSDWLKDLFAESRLHAVPMDVPISTGTRAALEKAYDVLTGVIEDNECYCGNEGEQCRKCDARRARDEIDEQITPRNFSMSPDRLGNIPERVFLEKWSKQCQRQRGLNNGYGSLELILAPGQRTGGYFGFPKYVPPVSQRDATVAASVIQWLGTNCGGCFLADCEREIKKLNGVHDEFMMGLPFQGDVLTANEAAADQIAKQVMRPDDERFPKLVKRIALAIQEAVKHVCPG